MQHTAVITIVADTDKNTTDITITFDPKVTETQNNYAGNTALAMLEGYTKSRADDTI